MSERVLRFGDDRGLVGVLAPGAGEPPPGGRTALVLLNQGIMHRVGPNRLHVTLARQLSRRGLDVLRFDFSGMGDSRTADDDRTFEQRAVREARQALDCLERERGVRRFIVGGICSGAVTAFDAAREDARVVGGILINPQFFDDDLTAYVEARRGTYWKRVLVSGARWREFLTGQADYAMIGTRLKGLILPKSKALGAARRTAAAFGALTGRGVEILLVYTADDWGLDYFEIILSSAAESLPHAERIRVEHVRQADHIFTPLPSQRRLLEIVEAWLPSAVGPRP